MIGQDRLDASCTVRCCSARFNDERLNQKVKIAAIKN